MTAPTQLLTQRAATHLGEQVALAIRVRQAPGQISPATEDDGSELMSPVPAGGFPVLPMLRSVRTFISDLFAGDEVLHGVLAFTESGDRVLLGRSQFRSKTPTHIIRRIPREAPVSVNMPLLAEHLIPELIVGSDHFVVNSIDFGALTRAVGKGDLNEPALSEQLALYYEHSRTFRSYDPNKMREMIPGQTKVDD